MTADPTERQRDLAEILEQRILILDGAMGTMLQQRGLKPEDFGGLALEGCNEHLVRTRPDVVLDIHRAYLAAGADVVATNSFGATRMVLADYGLADESDFLNRAAAQLARKAAEEFSTSSRPRFVAGAMGPTTKAITVTGGVTFPQLVETFHHQARALLEGGADLFLVETCQDTRNAKAALIAIDRLRSEIGRSIPVMLSATIEASGTMLAGQTAEAFCASVSHADLFSIGLNCATGPEFMTDHLRTISQMSPFPVSCYPNAGLPDEEGRYGETPESLASELERFVDHGWLNIMGGCCGTTDAHIRLIAQMADGKRPRSVRAKSHRTYFSGIELVEADESNRPLIVGERTNVVGSRLFKRLISEENWEEASEIAQRQVQKGAQISDVCLQSADRDELRDVPPFYERLIRKCKAPVMIDSTDAKVVELALSYCQGKSIINSINLEDGEEKFERVCPLAKRYGAALVVGCIDDAPVQAQAFTRERKLQVAERSYRLLTQKYGIAPEDIIIDPLVFPCATGDAKYIGGAVETMEAIRLVKQALPHVKTILGISNVSFGLPTAAREVVNSVFLYYCTKSGLDLAIVNSEKLERFASISEEERHMAENLLFNTPPPSGELVIPADWREQTLDQRVAINQHHTAAITNYFRQETARAKSDLRDLPLDQRLINHIVEGTQTGLTDDLDQKLAEGVASLDIINGLLMDGMREVGRLFNNNELIVAEILQSAEAMKAAVDYLQRFMERREEATRGTVLLATVKGDVHDIGKNLVEIILANNGYRVVNLGQKVSPEVLIAAYAEHKPDAIGLSGLLVKSTHQMVATASDFKAAGVRVPLLVGGAALSDTFTRNKIAAAYDGPVYYAKDAMAGLKLMNQIMDRQPPGLRQTLEPQPALVATSPLQSPHRHSAMVRTDLPIPRAPYLDRRVRDLLQLGELWNYINPYMLYGRHLGYKRDFQAGLRERDPKALALIDQIEQLKQEARDFLRVCAVWQFFEAEPDGDEVRLFAPGCETPSNVFHFPRQQREPWLCLSDYVLRPHAGARDHLALLAVTAGEGISDRVEQWKQAGEFFKAHAIQALAVESAEAAAEWLHRRIREEWGFADPASMTMQERFTAKYRGKRYSFGYPACPNLEEQQTLWKILRPEEIGIELTESMMMDPEASVSAVVFHHPDCTYFAAYDSPTQ